MRYSRTMVVATAVLALVLLVGCSSKSAKPSTSSGTSGGTLPATATVVATAGTDASATVGTPNGGTSSVPGSTGKPGAPLSGTKPKPGVNPEKNLGTDVLVYVSNTAQNRPLSGTEIRLGDSVFTPNTGQMMDRGIMGPLAAGQKATLIIYPDGRDGKKISIPVQAPAAGNADPRARIVDVAISDDGVRVLGVMVLPKGQGTHDRF